jgi:hypothetical protein
LTRVGPGRFTARVVADTTRPLIFSFPNVAGAANPARILVVDQAAEYRFAKPDQRTLAEISAATGGSIDPTVQALRDAPRNSGVARHPLAPWLLAAGIVLWLVDTILRRFRRSGRLDRRAAVGVTARHAGLAPGRVRS